MPQQKRNSVNYLSPITDADVHTLLLGIETLHHAQNLMAKQMIDINEYEKLYRTVSHLYDEISSKCPKAEHLLQELKKCLPIFREFKSSN